LLSFSLILFFSSFSVFFVRLISYSTLTCFPSVSSTDSISALSIHCASKHSFSVPNHTPKVCRYRKFLPWIKVKRGKGAELKKPWMCDDFVLGESNTFRGAEVSWKSISSLPCQWIISILWNPYVYYIVYNYPPIFSIQKEKNYFQVSFISNLSDTRQVHSLFQNDSST
jgi:hypothetical protein